MTGPTYRNPVYPRPFPDPFVLKFGGEYWGYCTGFWHDGRVFGVIHSRDLVQWEDRPGALEPLPDGHPHYWAPEVAWLDGRFYLYYSVGNEELMEIRVAVADHPAGPFVDSGRRLTREPFAIDAHVFEEDGRRWLFYATDFLTGSHVGTGTVRDRLLDPFTLAGDPRPVTLPRYDWHVYHLHRPEKGGVRWHTVEGPFVLARKGLLYEMFSGGNWRNPTYGVSYATARSVEEPGEWEQAADGARVLPILRSSGEVVGPGHNSVVRGPDNRQLYCVYHRWSEGASARVMAIDPLDWAGERMLVLGPTTTPQPAPNPPTISDLLDAPAVLAPGEELRYEAGAPTFLVEVSARAVGEEPGGLGFVLFGVEGTLGHIPFRLDPFVRLIRFEAKIPGPATGVVLVAEGAAVELSGFALTVGWEDRFEDGDDPAALGWEVLDGAGKWKIEGAELAGASATVSWIARGPALASYELVVNARLDAGSPGEKLGIAPALGDGETGPRLLLERRGENDWGLRDTGSGQFFPFPAAFDPFQYQQLRFRKQGGSVEMSWEGVPLGTVEAPAGEARIGLGAQGAAWFDAVRLTAIPD